MYEEILANWAARPRVVNFDGREFIVAPMSMLVPGVLNGSKGPLLYPEDEVTKDPDAWNGMPIVVYHPEKDGRHVSARDPEVLERYQVGAVYRTTTRNGKLDAEGWFDVGKTRAMDARLSRERPGYRPILPRLMKGKPVELSTGLFTENLPVENDGNNVHKGKAYSFVARNYKPDHLAVLPDQRGACSLEDGCGVMVNRRGHQIPATIGELKADLKAIYNALPSSSLDMSPAKACKIIKDGTVHGKPLTERQRGMFGALCGKQGKSATKNSSTTDPTTNSSEGDDMTRKQVIRYLTTNCDCWKGADKTLETMDDKQLVKLKNNAEHQAKMILVVNAAAEALGEEGDLTDEVLNAMPAKMKGICDDEYEDEPAPKGKKKPAANAAKNPPADADEDEWFAAAPPRIRSAVANAIKIENKAKADLIAKITANTQAGAKDRLVKRLRGMDLEALEDLASAIPDPEEVVHNRLGRRPLFLDEGDDDQDVDYAGAAGVTSNKGSRLDRDDEGDDEGLPLPTTNWQEAAEELDLRDRKGKKTRHQRRQAADA